MKLEPRSRWTRITALALLTLSLASLAQPGRAVEVTPLPDVTEADGRLGTCFAFYDGPLGSRATQAYAAGSRWDRFDFRWDVIEPSDNAFNFAPHTNVVAIDRAHGLNTVGILWGTPAWAAAPGCSTQQLAQRSDIPGHPQAAPQSITGTSACPPRDLALWYDYVYQVVAHFKADVHVWEIWNEPDLSWFWIGTPAQYADLLETGYLAAKAADPTATVLFGGLAYWGNPAFSTQVLNALAAKPGSAAHNGYFDALSLHLYYSVYTPYDVSRSLRQATSDRVGPHPLWITELGVPIWNEHLSAPYAYSATAEEAAAHVLEAYAEARAAGVEKVFYFRLHDDAANMGERFGLTRDDASIRPAYVAYQVAARYLRQENQITGPFGSSAVRITFWGTPRGRVDVLWNATPAPLTYTQSAILPTATLVDRHGVTTTLTASGGNFRIPLAPATNANNPDGSYHIGGPPVLLIQEDADLPTTTLTTPPLVYGPAITLTWSVVDATSGYWYAEIQRATAPTGPWTLIAGQSATEGLTRTTATVAAPGPWYFRARARDRVGNWEAWPATATASTTVVLTRTVALSITVFGDDNSNGLQDPGEALLSGTILTWQDGTGAIIAQGSGPTWAVTPTVALGAHWLRLSEPAHFAAPLLLDITGGPGVQVIALRQGMYVTRGRQYLPIILRGAPRP